MKFAKKVNLYFWKFIAYLSLAFSAIFLFIKLFFTTDSVVDHPYLEYIKFSYILPPIISAVLVGAVLFFAYKLLLNKSKKFIFNVTHFIVFFLSLGWSAYLIKVPLITDSFEIFHFASQFANNNFDGLNGSYLQNYPFQLGLIGFQEIIFRIFHSDSAVLIVLIFINCIMITFYYHFLYKISDLLFKSKQIQLLFSLLFIICLQIFLLVFPIYGWIPMQLFTAISLYYLLKCSKKFSWKSIIISVLCISFAYLFKSNALIFLIGICLYLLGKTMSTKANLLRNLFVLLIFICVPLSVGEIPKLVYEARSQINIESGMSKLTWINMGLTNKISTLDAPKNNGILEGNQIKSNGYFSGLTGDFSEESMVDITVTSKEESSRYLKTLLGENISQLSKNPIKSAEFFAKKYISQWGSASFSGIFNIILAERGNNLLYNIFMFYMSGFGLIIAVFTTYSFYNIRNEQDFSKQLIPLIILGGILYSTISEAQAIAVFPYYILMLPYAAKGIIDYKKL